jgi:hypothetical protein
MNMTTKTHLVALCRITGADNSKTSIEATGEFNADGSPKVKRIAHTTMPGEIFPAKWLNAADIDHYLSMEIPAARWANDAEMAIVEQMARKKGA